MSSRKPQNASDVRDARDGPLQQLALPQHLDDLGADACPGTGGPTGLHRLAAPTEPERSQQPASGQPERDGRHQQADDQPHGHGSSLGPAGVPVVRRRRFSISSTSAGSTVCRSPTTPKSAIAKIGCLRVLVDRDDRARALHAGPVLDRPRDAAGDVELGCDGLPGLADLEVAAVPLQVGGGARGRDGSAERVGEPLGEVRRPRPTPCPGRRRRPPSRRRGRAARCSSSAVRLVTRAARAPSLNVTGTPRDDRLRRRRSARRPRSAGPR